jgi:transposase
MEDLLDLYAEPYDPEYPVVCFDESPFQLIGETRVPVPPQPGKPARIDVEYRRAGTCNLFLFFEPAAGWRHVTVTARRTALDWAHCMRDLVDIHYPNANYISVVLDNLNTHTVANLYVAFPPAEARRIARRLELRYTPKHGSWLNMAECEFAVLRKQCLNTRIEATELVAEKTAAWEQARNAARATVKWRFTNTKARAKLSRLYPSTS